jgi:integrase
MVRGDPLAGLSLAIRTSSRATESALPRRRTPVALSKPKLARILLSTVRDTARWRRGIDATASRHTAATWLDHAGVSPKVASELMGHKTPEYQAGAATITLRRYTHTLPGELERARDLLDAFPPGSSAGKGRAAMIVVSFPLAFPR